MAAKTQTPTAPEPPKEPVEKTQEKAVASPETPQKPPELSTLERIKVLGELANAIQNDELKRVIASLPSGDRLLQIFTEAIAKEIDGLINPGNKAAPKEMVDVVSIAMGLKDLVSHTYAMMAEINRAPVLGTLNLLNQNLGGNGIQPFQGEQPELQGQQPQPRQQQSQQPSRQQVGGPDRGIQGMW